ncbi:MAG: hypothetical protein ACJAVZ_003774 [Afipia broomeae]|jgi:hypothetical protein
MIGAPGNPSDRGAHQSQRAERVPEILESTNDLEERFE